MSLLQFVFLVSPRTECSGVYRAVTKARRWRLSEAATWRRRWRRSAQAWARHGDTGRLAKDHYDRNRATASTYRL